MQRYSLVIVEDEDDIRHGLEHVINWALLGFEVTGSFRSCKEAIDFIQKNSIDVVLSDIVMPEISGLEFSRWLSEKRPCIKIVLLSGYRDFSYAQQAIQYHVKYYISKPTNIDELNKAFGQIKAELDSDEKQRLIAKRRGKSLFCFQQILLQKFVTDGKADAEFLPYLLPEQRVSDTVSTDYSWWSCILDSAASSRKQPDLSAFYEMNDRDDFFAIPVFAQDNTLILVVRGAENTDESYSQRLKIEIQMKLVALRKLFGYDYKFSRLIYFSSLARLVRKMAELKNAVGPKAIMQEAEFSDVDIQNLEKMKEALNQNDLSPVFNYIRYLDENNCSKTFLQLQSYCITLSLELRMRLEADDDLPELFSDGSIYRHIIMADNSKKLIDFSSLMMKEYQNRMGKMENAAIRNALDYIRHHIPEDVTLKDLSKRVYLNPAYFSRLFYKVVGEHFTEYLQKQKMKLACTYLKDSRYKVYQVCEMVGYKDVRNFYKAFRKIIGITPQEYRRKNN